MPIAELFRQDPDRFSHFSTQLDDLLFDFSKTALTTTALAALLETAREAGVATARDAMFAGKAINTTENRAVLHVALRAAPARSIRTGDQDAVGDASAVRQRFLSFAEAVRSGQIRGATGEAFAAVVSIGIGGSDLGPRMVADALRDYRGGGPDVRFVSNVDPAHLALALEGLDPARTLVIVASKTFTTLETMANARAARRWLSDALGEAAVADHFCAVSTNLDAVKAFGIKPDRVFGFWDWVGGRYSVWSAIGLPVALAIGAVHFEAFLEGARAMDTHFETAPLEANMPVLMALIGYWHRRQCGYGSRVTVPYDQHLALFPAWLAQLDMESNGKSVRLDGTAVSGPTGPVVWGAAGTDAQHSFFQLLHQGSDVVPVEFILAARSGEAEPERHAMLAANCLAQAQALMLGRDQESVEASMRASGAEEARVAAIAPHRVFAGNRPSLMLLHDRLTPHALGRLMALYEHRVFVEGVLFGVNSFDQWGVELGKERAGMLLPALTGAALPADCDASTAGLVAHMKNLQAQR